MFFVREALPTATDRRCEDHQTSAFCGCTSCLAQSIEFDHNAEELVNLENLLDIIMGGVVKVDKWYR